MKLFLAAIVLLFSGVAHAQTLGTATDNGAVTCPRGTTAGAACRLITVSNCGGVSANIAVTLATYTPSGASKGTVFLHNGATGQQPMNFGLPLTLKNYGFTVVQIIFASGGWEIASGAGIKAAACRPATAIRWAYDHIHQVGTTLGFCGVGSSAGTGAIYHALQTYGLSSIIDAAFFQAGPSPFGAIDKACTVGSVTSPINICVGQDGELDNAPYNYTGAKGEVNTWEGTTTCGSAHPLAADVVKWQADALTGGTFSQTWLKSYICTNSPNETAGLAGLLVPATTGLNGSMPMQCSSPSSTCTGELIWADAAYAAQLGDDVLARCVPNHTTAGLVRK